MIDLTKFSGITPGKWRVRQGHGLLFVDAPECLIDNRRGLQYATQILADEDYETKEADCAAVAALPELIAELRRLREIHTELVESITYAHQRLAAYVGLPVEQCTGGEFQPIVATIEKAKAVTP